MNEKLPAHRGCSYILPGYPNAITPDKTHSCYCSQWRQDGDKWFIWRDGKWQEPHRPRKARPALHCSQCGKPSPELFIVRPDAELCAGCLTPEDLIRYPEQARKLFGGAR